MGPQLIDRRSSMRRIARWQDAGSGPRCLLAEIALVKEGNANAFPGQEISSGEADNAAAEDQDVRMS